MQLLCQQCLHEYIEISGCTLYKYVSSKEKEELGSILKGCNENYFYMKIEEYGLGIYRIIKQSCLSFGQSCTVNTQLL